MSVWCWVFRLVLCSLEDPLVLLTDNSLHTGQEYGAEGDHIPKKQTFNEFFFHLSFMPTPTLGVLGPGYRLLTLYREYLVNSYPEMYKRRDLQFLCAVFHLSLLCRTFICCTCCQFFAHLGFPEANWFASSVLWKQLLLHLFSVSQSFLNCLMR